MTEVLPSVEPPTSTQIQFKYPSLLEYGAAILQTHDSNEKANLTMEAFDLFHNHGLPVGDHTNPPAVQDYPARPLNLEVVGMFEIKSKVKGNTPLQNRIRLIHSQAHIESYAIDITWDIMVRFASWNHEGQYFSRDFFVDWLKVANDEAKHFQIWDRRLMALDSHYGAVPTHDGLWESCFRTKDNILARMALLNLVLEAHGLDCAKRLSQQFIGAGDKESAKFILEIEKDEITHVHAGVRWFKHVCALQSIDPIPTFHQMVFEYFHGIPKPPYNEEARLKAGLTPEWYAPFATIKAPNANGGKLNIKEIMQRRKEKQEEGKQDCEPSDATAETSTVATESTTETTETTEAAQNETPPPDSTPQSPQ